MADPCLNRTLNPPKGIGLKNPGGSEAGAESMANKRPEKNEDNGSYILVLRLGQPHRIKAGRLPERHYTPGLYFYIGRAKRHLRGRLARHLRTEKKLRWHIDYLLQNAQIEEIWWRPGYFDECRLASDIIGMCGKDSSSIPGFGASDCRCSSHLIHYRGAGSRLSPLRNQIFHRKVKIDDIKNNPF